MTQAQPPTDATRRAPAAIVVSGPPASGKTTFAAALAAALGYAIVDLDTVTGPLTRAALELAGADPSDYDSPAADALRDARYTTLLDVARANLVAGIGVVLAAPFTRERREAAAWAALAGELARGDASATPVLFHLHAPAEILHARLSARDAARDRAKLRREPQAPGAETAETPIPDAVVLDATAPLETQLDAALTALAAQPRTC